MSVNVARGRWIVKGRGAVRCNGGAGVCVREVVKRGFSVLLFVVLSLFSLPLFGQRGDNRYALILEEPPLARQVRDRKELRTAASDDPRRRIEAAQASLRTELERRKIPVTGAVQTLLNAVFVAAPEDRLAELRSM